MSTQLDTQRDAKARTSTAHGEEQLTLRVFSRMYYLAGRKHYFE
jgi:hypothetical protein